ncbi:MAG TPA: hypothetical protein VGJ84_16285 [Polyangiaceae bacterium]
MLDKPIEFDIPAALRVVEGDAGNHEAVLSFRTADGKQIRCFYRGGSSQSHPTDALELAKARLYRFDHCQGGFAAGDRTQSNWFQLSVQSGDNMHPIGRTTVEVGLSTGRCSGELPPPLSAEETVRLRQSFSWQNTSALPETDAQGRPSLFYALIYVRTRMKSGVWTSSSSIGKRSPSS